MYASIILNWLIVLIKQKTHKCWHLKKKKRDRESINFYDIFNLITQL